MADVQDEGLALIVLADWHSPALMRGLEFEDEALGAWQRPITGGAHVPALNDLLRPFGAALGRRVFKGRLPPQDRAPPVAVGSAAALSLFPRGGALLFADLEDVEGPATLWRSAARATVPVLGFVTAPAPGLSAPPTAPPAGADPPATPGPLPGPNAVLRPRERDAPPPAAPCAPEPRSGADPEGSPSRTAGVGRVAVYGDSDCLDAAHATTLCYGLLADLVQYALHGTVSPALHTQLRPLDAAYDARHVNPPPTRPSLGPYAAASKTLHADSLRNRTRAVLMGRLPSGPAPAAPPLVALTPREWEGLAPHHRFPPPLDQFNTTVGRPPPLPNRTSRGTVRWARDPLRRLRRVCSALALSVLMVVVPWSIACAARNGIPHKKQRGRKSRGGRSV